MASYDFGDAKADPESKDHPDFMTNMAEARGICRFHNPKMPFGLTLYATDRAFGIHYKHPEEDLKSWSGVTVKFDQDNLKFVKEANDACEVMYRYAKAQESPKVERCGVKTTGYIGSNQKPVKSRLDEEGDVIW